MTANPTFKKLSPERQADILNAAIAVFARHGYYEANIDSICKEANISNGSLYRYFTSKENLYICACDYSLEVMFNDVYELDPPENKSIYDIISDMLVSTQRFYDQHPDFFLFYSDIWAASMNQFVPKVPMHVEERIDNFWAGLVKKGLAKGEIDPVFTPEYAAYLIDSQTLLFFFSLTSAYHKKRFDVFLRSEQGAPSTSELIEKMVENLRLSLSPR